MKTTYRASKMITLVRWTIASVVEVENGILLERGEQA